MGKTLFNSPGFRGTYESNHKKNGKIACKKW